MAVPLSSLYAFFMILVVGLAAAAATSPAKSAVVYQQIGNKPEVNPAPLKKVTIGDPLTTVTTMTGGATGYEVHDMVKNVIPPQPDSNRRISNHYKKSTFIQEHLKTAANGTNVGRIQASKEFNSEEARDVVHKDGRTLTTTKGGNHKHLQLGLHRKIDDTTQNVHTDAFDSCEECGKTSRSVNEGKDSALMKSREETGQLTTHYMESQTKVHDKNHTGSSEQLQLLINHKNQQKTGTMQTVHDGKDNLMVGAMHDYHTELVTGRHDVQRGNDEKDTAIGKVTKKTNVQRENIAAADIHEHFTNAYHDTPLHTFYMNNKQVRDDRFRQESIDAHYDTEVKRKDGVKMNAHVEKKTNIDTSRLQHVDELNIKAMPKAHPEQVTRVSLRARILDRDHVLLNQHNRKNTVTTMPDGGKRTMSVKEDRVVVKNLKTTPVGKPGQVDTSLPISEQVHNAEKIVVPANDEVMTPLVHHYRMKRIEQQ